MSLEISRHRAEDVPDRLHDRLWNLTLGLDGSMWEAFEDIVWDQYEDGTNVGVVHLARWNGRVVGWSLRFKHTYDRQWKLYVFVDPTKRRRGIGSALVRQATRYLSVDARVFPWDDISGDFWKKEIEVKKRRITT